MKICPRCQKTYSDEGLNFCLDDGTILTQSATVDQSLPATIFLNQTPPTNPNQPFGVKAAHLADGTIRINFLYSRRRKNRKLGYGF